MLYAVDATLGICCTWVMPYKEYAVLGVCRTRLCGTGGYFMFMAWRVLPVMKSKRWTTEKEHYCRLINNYFANNE